MSARFIAIITYLLVFVAAGIAHAGVAELELITRSERHPRPVMPIDRFDVDARLRSNVEFWIRIYSQYSSRQGLIHDAKYIDHVYEVVDLAKLEGDTSRWIRERKKKWREVLLAVHRKRDAPETLNEEERKVFQLFQDVNEPGKFLNAAGRKRLRFQLGQKDNFLEGYRQSGRYLPFMEEVFRNAGLPVELTRLPFVESSFNVRARSKVGASGIWQFMRSTGRLFLKVGEAVDERNDPLRATEAAARLLQGNFESLGRWPLAVTAYNHGRKGMMRAVRMVGSEDLEDLVDSYKGRTFGFASSNFFAEFLAAVEVEKNAEKYFGKVERAKPVPFAEARIPDYISIYELARFMSLDLEQVQDLNPGLTEAVISGKLLIPAGYSFRIPMDKSASKEAVSKAFLAGYAEIPSVYKLPAQRFRKYVK